MKLFKTSKDILEDKLEDLKQYVKVLYKETKETAKQMDKMLQTIIEQDKIIAELKEELSNIHHTFDCPCNSCAILNEESDYCSWWGIEEI